MLEKLISKFNTEETHIEIDTINQFENGTTTDKNAYTYTIYLINNADSEPITQESVDTFSFAETEMIYWDFTNALKK